MAAVTDCYICPRFGSVWIAEEGLEFATPDGSTKTWVKVPELQSWTLEADVEDPDQFVTSSTNGVAVAPCPGVTNYSISTNFKLCESDWLYCHILDEPAALATDWMNPTATKRLWWFFSWLDTAPPTTPTNHDRGVYVLGRADPSGFGIDNNTSTAAEAEPTVQIERGPFLPICTTYTGAPRPIDDGT